MNVIYNSDNYYVVEYSPQHGFELVDKQTQRGAFFQGDTANSSRSLCATSSAKIASPSSASTSFSAGSTSGSTSLCLCH